LAEFTDYTLMFELCSIHNRNFVIYDRPRLYLLGARYNRTGKEVSPEWSNERFPLKFPVPQSYPAPSLVECLSLVDGFDANTEGIVVVDAQFNRIKIKSTLFKLTLNAAVAENLARNISVCDRVYNKHTSRMAKNALKRAKR